MMFQQLAALVANSALVMSVAPEGKDLRVTIAQKKSKRGVPLNISVVGTPEELDRDLPGAIATAAGELAKPAPVAEQVTAQVDAARKPEEKKAAPAKPAKAKKASKPKPTPKPKPLKQAKTPRSRPARRVTLPGASRKPTPRPAPRTPSRDGVKHHLSKPNAEQCIADYVALKAQLGDKLNRETFIKKAKTGRRFERLWGMSWHKFVADAERSAKKAAPQVDSERTSQPEAAPAGAAPDLFDSATPPAGSKAAPSTEGAEPAAVADAGRPKDWPFPATPKDVELGQPKDDTSHGHDVYDQYGVYLSSITTKPEIGGYIGLLGHGHPLRVFSIDGRRVMVKTHEDAPTRVLKNADGVVLVGNMQRHVEVGEILRIARSDWTVTSYNDRVILVAPKEEQPA